MIPTALLVLLSISCACVRCEDSRTLHEWNLLLENIASNVVIGIKKLYKYCCFN